MEAKDLVQVKQQRIKEELQKLVPPGFNLFPYPKKRTEIYDKLDQFFGRDADFMMQVGYLSPTDKEYDSAYQNLRFFGGKLENYTDYLNVGPFYNDAELNRNLKEVCDYMIRFYELAEITIKRINDEEDVRLKLLQQQRDKEQNQLKQSEEKKEKAKSFFSGATQFRPGKAVRVKTTRISGIIPKRTAPQEVLEKISKPQLEAQETEEGLGGSKRIVSALGRLTLSLEQTNDNLEAAISKMAEDIANTKAENKKEVDEYRKRLANRGRKIGKSELGSSKVDVSGVVKKYVGSFFSGAGGAIRALAMFNMLEAFMNGRPLDALGPLLGIGATYLPAIGGLIAGMIGKKIIGGLVGVSRGGAAVGGGMTAARGARSAASMPKMGKFGAIAALGAGALALGSGMLSKKEEGEGSVVQDTGIQARLDELETQQKESVQPQGLGAIPDSALKRFEALNLKFEKALDFLLKKQKEVPQQRSSSSSGGGGGGSPSPGNLPTSLDGSLKEAADIITGYESATSGGYNAMNRGIGGDSPEGPKHYFGKDLTDMSIGDVINLQNRGRSTLNAAGRYQFTANTLPEAMNDARLKESDKFSAENQDKMFAAHFTKSGPGKWTNWWPNARSQDVQRLNEIWQESKSSAQPTPTPPPAPALPRPQASAILAPTPKIARVPNTTPNMVALTLPSPSQNSKSPMSIADSGGSNISNVGTGIDYTFASRSGVGIFNA